MSQKKNKWRSKKKKKKGIQSFRTLSQLLFPPPLPVRVCLSIPFQTRWHFLIRHVLVSSWWWEKKKKKKVLNDFLASIKALAATARRNLQPRGGKKGHDLWHLGRKRAVLPLDSSLTPPIVVSVFVVFSECVRSCVRVMAGGCLCVISWVHPVSLPRLNPRLQAQENHCGTASGEINLEAGGEKKKKELSFGLFSVFPTNRHCPRIYYILFLNGFIITAGYIFLNSFLHYYHGHSLSFQPFFSLFRLFPKPKVWIFRELFFAVSIKVDLHQKGGGKIPEVLNPDPSLCGCLLWPECTSACKTRLSSTEWDV